MRSKYQLTWILHDTLGIFFGIAVAAGILTLESRLWGQPVAGGEKLISLGIAIGGGLLAGTIMARFQWRILRRRYAGLSWFKWWRNTTIAFTTGWILAMVPGLMYNGTNAMGDVVSPFGVPLFTVEYGSIIFGALLGGLIGFGQWFVLKQHRAQAGQWIGANVFSWSFGMFLLALAGLIFESSTILQGFLTTGLFGGLVAALCIAGFTSMFFEDAIAE